MPWPDHNDYLKIYRDAHSNAADLLWEAEILFDRKCFSRSYFLAFTALEEISKSQFAADVFTKFSKEKDFKKLFKNHNRKLGRMAWAHLDANSYPNNIKWVGPDIDDVERINPQKPNFQKRQNALYVGIDFKNQAIVRPKEQISEKDAKEMMRVVEVALNRIWEVSEYYGEQVGTKGFMK